MKINISIIITVLLAALLALPCCKKEEYPDTWQNPASPTPPPPSSPTHISPVMILVAGGSYEMGDWLGPTLIPTNSQNIKDPTDAVSQDGTGIRGRYLTFDATNLHTVTVDSFYIGKYEVTFDEFDKFTADTGRAANADEGWGRGSRPVIYVTWYAAVAYCNWLSEKEGLEKCYTIQSTNVQCDFSNNGYRLPTEAEWEYAARSGPLLDTGINGGHGNIYSGASNHVVLQQYAWYITNSSDMTHPVGTKLPNELGLYDMSGNVWEWVWDYYSPNYYLYCFNNPSECDNPKGPATYYVQGSYDFTYNRVLRGASWGNVTAFLRAVFRFFSLNQVLTQDPYYTNYRIGFRLCRKSG